MDCQDVANINKLSEGVISDHTAARRVGVFSIYLANGPRYWMAGRIVSQKAPLDAC